MYDDVMTVVRLALSLVAQSGERLQQHAKFYMKLDCLHTLCFI